MTLKTLLIASLFGLLGMDGSVAASPQTSIPIASGVKVELVAYYSERFCEHHPHRCHHHWQSHPYEWYNKEYRDQANFCRHHPYRERCERFCHFNRHICFG